jgi:hypothetical protein
MDCPTCGLANPPGALLCDCGYDFKSMQPSETPGWEIHLAWRQKVAAFWSISWPAFVVSLIAIRALISRYEVSDFAHRAAISIGGRLVFFGVQALLTRRLVRKNYRTFRVGTVREGGERSRKLSMREAGLVWLWILGPQLALILTTSIITWSYVLPPETGRAISGLSLWINFLVVGPYAIALALRVKYPGFRLQSYGFRYI